MIFFKEFYKILPEIKPKIKILMDFGSLRYKLKYDELLLVRVYELC